MDKKIKLSLLKGKDVEVGPKDTRLEIFQKYGISSPVTDLAIITGNFYFGQNVIDDESLKGRIAPYYTQDEPVFEYLEGNARNKFFEFLQVNGNIDEFNPGIRPVFKYSASDINKSSIKLEDNNGIMEFEYGYYPQYAASRHLQNILFNNLKNDNLKKTGRKYNLRYFDKNTAMDNSGIAFLYDEYEYKHKRYILVKTKLNNGHHDIETKISNGLIVNNGDYIWIEVQPVTWMYDSKTSKCISKRTLIADVKFKRDEVGEREIESFKNSDVYKFMNKYMLPDMFQDTLNNQKDDDYNNIRCYGARILPKWQVLSGEYTEIDILLLTRRGKIATMVNLSAVDVDNIYEARKFCKLLGKNYLICFDELWISRNPEKAYVIEELRQAEKEKVKVRKK